MSARGAPASWVDGLEASAVSLLDRGLHYGDGVFETITCVDGRPRFLGRHLARLERGRERLGLRGPPVARLREEIEQAARDQDRALLKLIVTRGTALGRGYQSSGAESGTRILLRYAWPPEPAARARDGVRVRLGTLRFAANPALAGLKHLNRLEQVLARREWLAEEVFESLHLAGSGRLASGTMSNVFLVVGGRIVTPSVEDCAVAGVMRELVLDTAAQQGIATAIERPGLEELERAEEVFLTNVRIGIVPVARIGERALAPGVLTRRLQAALRDAC